MSALIALALLLPPAALAALAVQRLWRPALLVAPLLLPVLALLDAMELATHVLLLGARFGVDDVNRPLLLAGAGWVLAGWFAGTVVRERPREFAAYWLMTLAGHSAAMLAGNLAAFYLGYVVMTVAAYGLVVHARSEEAWRAGRVYMVLAIAGEALVLTGLLMLGAANGNADFGAPGSGPASWLLLAGFAVKLGVVPLHVWLPLAHPVAPAPASAVLSGLLVKAGLLGMLRFVAPAGMDWVMAVGLFTAAYGAVVGLFQARLKTVLAYSTISQMGLALTAFAAGAAPAVIGVFVLHHGLNKIALFIAAGHRVRGRLAGVLFLLPAAALAGLPLTSGALAKTALKDVLAGPWGLALPVSAALTTLLMLHAWRLARARDGGLERPHPAWIMAVAAGLIAPWAFALQSGLSPGLGFGEVATAVLPVVAGAGLFAAWSRLPAARDFRLPEGDVVVWLERLCRRAVQLTGRALDKWMDFEPAPPDLWPRESWLRSAEIALGRLAVAGLFLLVILLALWLALR